MNLLACLMRDFPDSSLGLFEGDQLKGFIQARITDIMCDIGPWIMKKPEVEEAKLLLETMLSMLPTGKKTILGVSERNQIAKTVLEQKGFEIEFYNQRLVRARQEVSPFSSGTLAISAFELG